jgi:hypothetical protein
MSFILGKLLSTWDSYSSLTEVINKHIELGMVVYPCNLSTQEAEVGGSRVRGQPGLYSEILSQKIK